MEEKGKRRVTTETASPTSGDDTKTKEAKAGIVRNGIPSPTHQQQQEAPDIFLSTTNRHPTSQQKKRSFLQVSGEPAADLGSYGQSYISEIQGQSLNYGHTGRSLLPHQAQQQHRRIKKRRHGQQQEITARDVAGTINKRTIMAALLSMENNTNPHSTSVLTRGANDDFHSSSQQNLGSSIANPHLLQQLRLESHQRVNQLPGQHQRDDYLTRKRHYPHRQRLIDPTVTNLVSSPAQQRLLDMTCLMSRSGSSASASTAAALFNDTVTPTQQPGDLLLNASTLLCNTSTELNNFRNNIVAATDAAALEQKLSLLPLLAHQQEYDALIQEANNHPLLSSNHLASVHHPTAFHERSVDHMMYPTSRGIVACHPAPATLRTEQDQRRSDSILLGNMLHRAPTADGGSSTTALSLSDVSSPQQIMQHGPPQQEEHVSLPPPLLTSSSTGPRPTAQDLLYLNQVRSQTLALASALSGRRRDRGEEFSIVTNNHASSRGTMEKSSNMYTNQQEEFISKRPFLSLGLVEQDKHRLSDFLCFLRRECIEVFKASAADVSERKKSKKVVLGQVGIRCRFCTHLRGKERVGRSSSFPSSLDRIYQCVAMMIRDHFSKCTLMLPEIREKYEMYRTNNANHLLAGRKKRRGITKKESKSYWVESASLLGMSDTVDKGIKMTTDLVPRSTCSSISNHYDLMRYS